MYRQHRPFRSGQSGRFGRGNFNGARSPRRIKTLSSSDPSLFIKAATPDTGESEPLTHLSFNDFNIPQILKDNIAAKGYTIPTPIQDKTIEPMLAGRDLIGIANTGTGKTAAFLIPIINKIFLDRNKRAIIITPTRELAVQIHQELLSFTTNIKIYSALVIGGTNMRRQIQALRTNPHVVIGTPGRIKDVITQRVLNLDTFDTVVLDEVDLMVDIGFVRDVTWFISLLPKVRQSLFFSATVAGKVSAVLQQFVTNPITISVKTQETAQNVTQDIIRVVNHEQKIDQLHQILIKEGFDKVLIFGRTKHGIEKLYKLLTLRGFRVGAIHGNKSQGHRQAVLQSFKRNEIKILLATDVASRGLDIPNVSHVINYEMPESYTDYIHRIGRTGRANQTGTALTFIE